MAEKKGGRRKQAKANAEAENNVVQKSGRPYPNRSPEDALKIPTAIRVKNNGNAFATEDVAQAA